MIGSPLVCSKALLHLWSPKKGEVCCVCLAPILPPAGPQRARSPNLERSLQIEKAKKRCIRYRICNSQIWENSYPCEFGAYELGECRNLDPALADFKVAQRHLEAEVRTCELDKRTNRLGQTVYQWPSRRSTGHDDLVRKGKAQIVYILFLSPPPTHCMCRPRLLLCRSIFHKFQ